MYAKFSGLESKKLKPFHHVRLDQEFKNDCQVWIDFLNSGHISTIFRPFVDLKKVTMATELNFYTDASKNENFGFGCVFGKSFTYSR